MRFSSNPLVFIPVLLSAVLGGALAQSDGQGKELAGKYYIETLPLLEGSVDTIEFLPKEKCLVTFGDKPEPVSGSYHGITDGMLTVEFGDPKTVLSYKAVVVKGALMLTDNSDQKLYFALRPAPPWPKAQDLMGTYHVKRDEGDFIVDYVYTRTGDRIVKTIMRVLSKADHTYQEFHLTQEWEYADGISVYRVTKDDLPPEAHWVLSRDFISKRDEKGIWSLDTSTGEYVCEVPVDKLELPAPPVGYQKVP